MIKVNRTGEGYKNIGGREFEALRSRYCKYQPCGCENHEELGYK